MMARAADAAAMARRARTGTRCDPSVRPRADRGRKCRKKPSRGSVPVVGAESFQVAFGPLRRVPTRSGKGLGEDLPHPRCHPIARHLQRIGQSGPRFHRFDERRAQGVASVFAVHDAGGGRFHHPRDVIPLRRSVRTAGCGTVSSSYPCFGQALALQGRHTLALSPFSALRSFRSAYRSPRVAPVCQRPPL